MTRRKRKNANLNYQQILSVEQAAEYCGYAGDEFSLLIEQGLGPSLLKSLTGDMVFTLELVVRDRRNLSGPARLEFEGR